jgi:hypothetical protein
MLRPRMNSPARLQRILPARSVGALASCISTYGEPLYLQDALADTNGENAIDNEFATLMKTRGLALLSSYDSW